MAVQAMPITGSWEAAMISKWKLCMSLKMSSKAQGTVREAGNPKTYWTGRPSVDPQISQLSTVKDLAQKCCLKDTDSKLAGSLHLPSRNRFQSEQSSIALTTSNRRLESSWRRY